MWHLHPPAGASKKRSGAGLTDRLFSNSGGLRTAPRPSSRAACLSGQRRGKALAGGAGRAQRDKGAAGAMGRGGAVLRTTLACRRGIAKRGGTHVHPTQGRPSLPCCPAPGWLWRVPRAPGCPARPRGRGQSSLFWPAAGCPVCGGSAGAWGGEGAPPTRGLRGRRAMFSGALRTLPVGGGSRIPGAGVCLPHRSDAARLLLIFSLSSLLLSWSEAGICSRDGEPGDGMVLQALAKPMPPWEGQRDGNFNKSVGCSHVQLPSRLWKRPPRGQGSDAFRGFLARNCKDASPGASVSCAVGGWAYSGAKLAGKPLLFTSALGAEHRVPRPLLCPRRPAPLLPARPAARSCLQQAAAGAMGLLCLRRRCHGNAAPRANGLRAPRGSGPRGWGAFPSTGAGAWGSARGMNATAGLRGSLAGAGPPWAVNGGHRGGSREAARGRGPCPC